MSGDQPEFSVMTARHSISQLYRHLLSGDELSVRSLFDSTIALNTPLSGAIDGDDAFAKYFTEEGSWLRRHHARVEVVTCFEDADRQAAELVIYLQLDGKELDLPVAIIGQKSAHAFGQIRIYHSMWAIQGRHVNRVPIVWPGRPRDEPWILQSYFSALRLGDAQGMLETFSDDGYVREPGGRLYTHKGVAGRAKFYEAVTRQPGGVGLTHATSTFDKKMFAVEYICHCWGRATFAPMAGCAFYMLSDDAKHIDAIRIYDDVTPP